MGATYWACLVIWVVGIASAHVANYTSLTLTIENHVMDLQHHRYLIFCPLASWGLDIQHLLTMAR